MGYWDSFANSSVFYVFGDLGRPKLPKNKKNPLNRPNLRTVRGSLPLASEAEPERMPLGLGRAQCARRPSSQPSRKLRAGWERPVNLRPRKTSCHAGIVYSPANEYETKKSSPKRRLHPKKRFFFFFLLLLGGGGPFKSAGVQTFGFVSHHFEGVGIPACDCSWQLCWIRIAPTTRFAFLGLLVQRQGPLGAGNLLSVSVWFGWVQIS